MCGIMKTALYIQPTNDKPARAKLAGVSRAARSAGWHLQVVSFRDEESKPDIGKLLEFWRPDGVIVDCGHVGSEVTERAFGRIPVVFLDDDPGPRGRGRLRISPDSAATGRLAARELLRLGLTNFGFLGHPRKLFWSEERLRGFLSAVRLNNCEADVFRPPRIVRNVSDLQPSLRKWLAALPKPCGIFAANDRIAAQAISACIATGIDIPNEVAIIGVDDDDLFCENPQVSLTSIQLDFESAGHSAMEMLAARCRSPRMRTEMRRFGNSLVMHRASTKILRRHDARVAEAITYIREHACDGISVGDVAAFMKISRRLAELRFRECAGRTILDEIHAVRIQCACQLLLGSSLPVSSVSTSCGYASQNAFCRMFTKTIGKTPSVWRRKHGSATRRA